MSKTINNLTEKKKNLIEDFSIRILIVIDSFINQSINQSIKTELINFSCFCFVFHRINLDKGIFDQFNMINMINNYSFSILDLKKLDFWFDFFFFYKKKYFKFNNYLITLINRTGKKSNRTKHSICDCAIISFLFGIFFVVGSTLYRTKVFFLFLFLLNNQKEKQNENIKTSKTDQYNPIKNVTAVSDFV